MVYKHTVNTPVLPFEAPTVDTPHPPSSGTPLKRGLPTGEQFLERWSLVQVVYVGGDVDEYLLSCGSPVRAGEVENQLVQAQEPGTGLPGENMAAGQG